jgi:hypothetical protein
VNKVSYQVKQNIGTRERRVKRCHCSGDGTTDHPREAVNLSIGTKSILI